MTVSIFEKKFYVELMKNLLLDFNKINLLLEIWKLGERFVSAFWT